MEDEIWTTKDGQKIAVGDMDDNYVRNALRMVLRQRRRVAARIIGDAEELYFTEDDGQAMLNDQYRRDLANPACFYPLLDGGVYGSPDLQRKYGGNI